MANFLLDLDNNIKEVREGSKLLAGGIGDLNKSFDKTLGLVEKSKIGFTGLSKTIIGVGVAASTLVDASVRLQAIVEVGNAGYEAWKKFQGIEETVDFAEAISGSKEFGQSLQKLEQISDNVFNRITLSAQAIFDTKNFNAFSNQAVTAYSSVEQAAYRLSTVTVASGERSIDALGRNLKITRELQQATNDAVGSVKLLDAQYQIASAGFTGKQDNKNVTKAAVNLSQAGFGTLQGSTDALVRGLRSTGSSSAEADKQAAQFFETTRVGLLTLDQLTPTIGTLGNLSKQSGLDLSELEAALAGFTTQGVSADEGLTRLVSLIDDISAASPEANKQLAAFKDEAGKPIQLNASTLREKGLKGVVEDLQKATGGRQADIQKIFANQTSQQAVKTLGTLGTKNLGEYTSRIKNVNPDDLQKEAEGRQQTIQGAFEKAQNSSQRQIEDFGKGAAPEVLENLEKTNSYIKTLGVGGAQAIGSLTGGFAGLSTKIKAVGGFILTAFSVVAPLALIAIIGKGIAGLGSKFKSLQKEGEQPFDSIKRVALTFFNQVEERFIELIKRIQAGVAGVKAEIQGALEAPSQGSLFNTDKYTDINKQSNTEHSDASVSPKITEKVKQLELIPKEDVFARAREDTVTQLEKVKSTVTSGTQAVKNSVGHTIDTARKGLNTAASTLKQAASDISTNISKSKLGQATQKSIGAVGEFGSTKLNQAKDFLSQGTVGKRVGGALTGIGDVTGITAKVEALQGKLNGVTGAFSKLSGVTGGLKGVMASAGAIIKQTAAYLGEMAAGGILLGGVFAIVSGQFSAFTASLNSRALPAVQELNESLKDISSNTGLAALSKSLDPIKDGLVEDNNLAQGFQLVLGDVSRGWSLITGETTKAELALKQYDKALYILNDANEKNVLFAKKGLYQGDNDESRTAIKKVKSGDALGANDVKALNDDIANKEKQIDLEVTLAKKKYEIAKNDAHYNADDLETLRQQTEELTNQADAKKKALSSVEKQLLVQGQLNALNKVDTSKELQPQVSKQAEQGIQSQIKTISGTFKQAFDGALKDPDKFERLQTDIQDTIGSIQVQISTDPASARRLRDELVDSVPDIGKLIYSNPNLRAKLAELNQQVTESTVKSATTVESGRTAFGNAAEALGSQSTSVAAEKYAAQVDSINQQVSVLNDELARPETTLERQKELVSQIEELEAKRLNARTDVRIKQELNTRKQLVSISETLLSVDQARINLLQGENAAFSLSITGAKAKLLAAQEQLKVSQEQIKISNREDIIKKEEIAKADANRKGRLGSLGSIGGNYAFTGGAEKANGGGTITRTSFGIVYDPKGKADTKTTDDLAFTKTLGELKQKFTNLDKTVEIAKLTIDAQYASQIKLIEQGKALGSSFDSLGSTASSLFSNSSLGAQLSSIGKSLADPAKEALSSADINIAKNNAAYDQNVKILQQLGDSLDKAQSGGASDEVIGELKRKQAQQQDIVKSAGQELPSTNEAIKQQAILNALNGKLQVFQSRVNVANDQLQKFASVAKDREDFEQSRKELTAETNKSGRSLQSSFIGFLGKNNPAAAALQQRSEVKQNNEDATLQKSKNVSDAKKEIIDLTVQKEQLDLESKGYQNALAQTLILTDVANLLQGKGAQFTQGDTVQKQIQQIPQLIQASAKQASLRGGLIDDRLRAASGDLATRNANVERDRIAKNFSTLGNNQTPANADLQIQTIKDFRNANKNFKPQEIKTGSLRDSSFQQTLAQIQSFSSGLNPNYGLGKDVLTTQTANFRQQYKDTRQQTVSNGTTINSPINLQITVPGGGAVDDRVVQDLKQHVNTQVQSGINNLARQLAASAKKV